MQLILTDDVHELGKRGQVVEVAAGYGRNYLIPKGLAVAATPGNLKMVEQQRLALAKKEAKFKEEADLLAKELNGLHLALSRKAGDTGALFGSVTAKDLTDLLEDKGFHVDRRKVTLEHPIKSIGNFTVEAHPHSEVEAHLLVSVLIEEDEPVAKVLKKGDAESDKIAALVEAEVKKIEQQAAREEAEAQAKLAALEPEEEEPREPGTS